MLPSELPCGFLALAELGGQSWGGVAAGQSPLLVVAIDGKKGRQPKAKSVGPGRSSGSLLPALLVWGWARSHPQTYDPPSGSADQAAVKHGRDRRDSVVVPLQDPHGATKQASFKVSCARQFGDFDAVLSTSSAED